MKIIDELISKISEEGISITDILIRTKVLAFQLKNEKLKVWIDNELNGYKSASELPHYRVLHCEIMGTISNGFQRASNYPIPLIGLEDDMAKQMKTFNLFQSISAIDIMLLKGDNAKMIMNISPDFYGYLSKDFDNGFQIEIARREISKTQIIQVLTAVKSKLLDFLLELNDAFGEESVQNLSQGKEKETITSLFNSSVFGDNTTIIVGNENSQNFKIENNLLSNFKELENYFTENKIEAENITELSEIIDTDNPNNETKEFGNKVKSWISKMITKSMDGSWTIGLSAAGKVLADGISKYYGWK